MEWVLDLVLMGGCLLVFYFNRRWKWAMPAAISCFVVAGLVFAMEMPKYQKRPPAKPLPKVEDVRKQFEASAQLATTDMTYHGAGFSIQVPAGYSYLKMEEPMMLLASRGDHASGIAVFRHDLGHDDPEPVVRQTLELMKKKNGTYDFSPLNVNGKQEFSAWFHVTKNGVPLRGLLIFAERDDKLWELTLTEPATEQDAALYRIAQTWFVE